jgi:2-oxo-hept-3-ene-1,7-dioate hydratase
MSRLAEDTLNSIANQMLIDYDARNPGTVFADGLRLELTEAWRLQSAVARLREQRGETVVGYKIGCVIESSQRANGLSHPGWARLWSTEQHSNGASLRKSDFANVALEAEFAVTLDQDIDAGNASAEEVAVAVENIFPVLELHNLVMRGSAPTGHELIANNGIHAGVVRGQGLAVSTELLTTDLALVFDGEIVDSWASLQWPCDILSAVKWLAEQLAASGQRLLKGNMILTGAFGPPIPLGDKTRIDATSSAFGNVSATFS